MLTPTLCERTRCKVRECVHGVVDVTVSIKYDSEQTVSLLSDRSISISGCTPDINWPFMTFR